jgi:diguanylate cyclase (GGDEF)-like protein
LLGGLSVVAFEPAAAFGAPDVEVLELIAGIAATALNRLEHTERLRQLAETDPLTGLANRRKALIELQQMLVLASQQAQPVAIGLLELDHFKQVNDRYGHAVGDLVLGHIGAVLRATFRRSDVVARWGGEEFLVGLYGCSKAGLRGQLRRALLAIEQAAVQANEELIDGLSFSAGVAGFPVDGADLTALCERADQALYLAKAHGRARVEAA